MRAKPKEELWRYVVLAAIIGIAVGLSLSTFLFHDDNTKVRALASTPTNTINVEQQNQLAMIKACRIYEQAKQNEAQTVIKNFVRHGMAHRKLMKGQMSLGDIKDPKPGTVRWEWKITLAELWEHEPMWREAVENYDKAGCGQ